MALGRVKSIKSRAQNWLEGGEAQDTARGGGGEHSTIQNAADRATATATTSTSSKPTKPSHSAAAATGSQHTTGPARGSSKSDMEKVHKRRQLPTVPPTSSASNTPTREKKKSPSASSLSGETVTTLHRLEELVEQRRFSACVDVVQSMTDDEFASCYQQLPYVKLCRSFSPDQHCLGLLLTLLGRIADHGTGKGIPSTEHLDDSIQTHGQASDCGGSESLLHQGRPALEFPVRACHELVVQLGMFLATAQTTSSSFVREISLTHDMLSLLHTNMPDILPTLRSRRNELATAIASLKKSAEKSSRRTLHHAETTHHLRTTAPKPQQQKEAKQRRASFSAHSSHSEHSLLSRKSANSSVAKGGSAPVVAPNPLDEAQRSVRESVAAAIKELKAGLEKLDSAAAVAPIAKPHGHGRDGHRSGQQREAVGLNKSNGDQKLQHLDLADLQNRFFATQSILNALKKETLTTLLEQMTEEAAKDKQVLSTVNQMKQDLPSGVLRNSTALEPLLSKHLLAIDLVIGILTKLPSPHDAAAAAELSRKQQPPSSLPLTSSGSTPNNNATNGKGSSADTMRNTSGDSSSKADAGRAITPTRHSSPSDTGAVPPVYTVEHGVIAMSPVRATRPQSAPLNGKTRSAVSAAGPVDDSDDLGVVSALQEELDQAHAELLQSCEMVNTLRRREKELTDRLAEQAQRQIALSGRFESLGQPSARPTQLVEQFADLYSQSRVEVIDALAEVDGDTLGMASNDDDVERWQARFISKIVDICFVTAQSHSSRRVQAVLDLLADNPPSQHRPAVSRSASNMSLGSLTIEMRQRHLQSALHAYMREEEWSEVKVTEAAEDVFMELWKIYPDSRALENYPELGQFTLECLRLAWNLSLQVPKIYTYCEAQYFLPDMLTRFYTSDMSGTKIKYYLWPCLVQGADRILLAKGVVVT